MSRVTPNELSEMTSHAKTQVAEKKKQQKDAALERRLAEEQKQILRADKILIQMSSKCRLAARLGCNFAIIMDLKLGIDYSRNSIVETSNSTELKVMLGGAANLVHTSCRTQGFSVSTHRWHDGVGIESGWQLKVDWPEK